MWASPDDSRRWRCFHVCSTGLLVTYNTSKKAQNNDRQYATGRCTLQRKIVLLTVRLTMLHINMFSLIICSFVIKYLVSVLLHRCVNFHLHSQHVCVCVCTQKGGETKDEMTVWTADATHSKYTHFLISHVELPAAPQESNNDLVITPRQLTKELLTRKSSDFTSEKRRPTSLYNSCQIVQ